jgi:hypothetical protein
VPITQVASTALPTTDLANFSNLSRKKLLSDFRPVLLMIANVALELWALFVPAFGPQNLTRHTIGAQARSRINIHADFQMVLRMGEVGDLLLNFPT